jgi:hypothetical protein
LQWLISLWSSRYIWNFTFYFNGSFSSFFLGKIFSWSVLPTL